MRTLVSLWSADLVNVAASIDTVAEYTDGFHIDIMDGSFVRALLFGPDFVQAVRRHTDKFIDVHLMVDNADSWASDFIEAGANMITFHTRSTDDGQQTIKLINSEGAVASHAIEVEEEIESIPVWDSIGRYVLMGTAIGIKGVETDPRLYGRLTALRSRIDSSSAYANAGENAPEIWVDGGIRQHTVPRMAECGAEGVIPGSIVLAATDPCAALNWIHSLETHSYQRVSS